ncbi:MAG: nicotinate phosphoribosyltransferase [Bacilli bacterium]|nr:nicotinate phosphoribosyltransferase [Bacilli bacterium]
MRTYNGHERLTRNYTLMSDEYEFSMANGYLQNGKENEEAVFDIFFRKVPNNGGYAIMAGIDKIIPYIENLKFGEQELNYFRRKGYPEEFINYLKNFKFHGSIYAIPDGTPVFPNEPLVTVKAPLIEAQIVETALLSIVNGAMEHATGARRIIEAVPKNVGVMEFGARRADGMEAAIDASIYGIMAGCVGTSNMIAADMVNLKGMGTQAHSWIESYENELEAFKAYARTYPNNCILLVDTIDTLRSGIPNAIKTFEYMKENGLPVDHISIRIDSGDLAYLSKETRKMLDNAGFPQAKICLSNGLTAETIESLINQGAKFDSLGVGDNISKPEGRMGCVYKEVALNSKGNWEPKIKLSNDTIKIVNPGYKRLYRAYDKTIGYAIADIMDLYDKDIKKHDLNIVSVTDYLKQTTIDNFDLVELQKPIFENGVLVYDDPELLVKQNYCNEQMNTLYPEVKRPVNPTEYYVDGTEDYVNFKNDLIVKIRKLVK